MSIRACARPPDLVVKCAESLRRAAPWQAASSLTEEVRGLRSRLRLRLGTQDSGAAESVAAEIVEADPEASPPARPPAMPDQSSPVSAAGRAPLSCSPVKSPYQGRPRSLPGEVGPRSRTAGTTRPAGRRVRQASLQGDGLLRSSARANGRASWHSESSPTITPICSEAESRLPSASASASGSCSETLDVDWAALTPIDGEEGNEALPRREELVGLMSRVRQRTGLIRRLQVDVDRSILSHELVAAAASLEIAESEARRCHDTGYISPAVAAAESVLMLPAHAPTSASLQGYGSTAVPWIPDGLQLEAPGNHEGHQADLRQTVSVPVTFQSSVRRPSAVPPLWIGAWSTPLLPPVEMLGGVSPSSLPERVLDGPQMADTITAANTDGSGTSEADVQDGQDFWGWLSFRSTLGSLVPEIRTHTF